MFHYTSLYHKHLDEADNMRVSYKHVDHPITPLVSEEHTTTVTATEDPVLSPEVDLLDLRGERERERASVA